MRQCMVVFAYYPMGETLVQRQAEALLSRGHAVDVICLRLPGEEKVEVVNGISVYRLPMTRSMDRRLTDLFREYLGFFVRALIQLAQLHHSKKYHIVQVYSLPDFLVFCAWMPKLFGARVIFEDRDLMPEFFSARSGRALDDFWVRVLAFQEQLACAFADHVITVTEAWRQVLIARGVPPAKCSVVMNLADARYFHPLARKRRDETGLHLIYHGTFTARYGLDLLLRAVASVCAELPGLRVTLHGAGDTGDALKRLAQELDLNERVRFSENFVPVHELPALLYTADVGVVPYRSDLLTDMILPTKLLEYAALGMPVLASRTTGMTTYFDETMIEFFNAEDADDFAKHIRLLYHNRARLDLLAENILKFNRQYNWASEAEKYVQLVESLTRRAEQVTSHARD